MSLPLVAIVGRPNVGKSTLFNRMIGHKAALVHDRPGVTRDRVYGECEWLGQRFGVVDTGGMAGETEDKLVNLTQTQIHLAIEESDLIIFLVDGLDGLIGQDQEIALQLLTLNKPVILVVNKAEMRSVSANAVDFFNLGLGDYHLVSAQHGEGVGDMLDAVVKSLPEVPASDEELDDVCRIALVGRQNVGKSSILNKLLGEERAIISDIPGTTRDSIDTSLEYKGRNLILVDTAGLRRRSKIKDNIEYYSSMRAKRSIERCDIALLVLDASRDVAAQDMTIADDIREEGKACIILVNKWDMIEKDAHTIYKFEEKIREKLKFMFFVPIMFISALEGKRINKILDLALDMDAEYNRRISTPELNRFLQRMIDRHHPASIGGNEVKIHYITQFGVKPPTFGLFVNKPKLIQESYKRYLFNRFYEEFKFKGTPVRLIMKNKNPEKETK